MTDPDLLAAGFDPNCPECREAVSYHQPACPDHYVPTHKRSEPPGNGSTCDDRKRPEAVACRRCRAAGVV